MNSLEQTFTNTNKTFSANKLLVLAYPWLVITFCALFLFYKYLLQVSPSVMTNDLMRVFHLNGAGLGNLAAVYFYVYLIGQLFAGPLFDRYSPRLLSTFAILFSGAGALLFAHANSLTFAFLARGLIGLGAAFATVCYLKMTANWFKPAQFAFVSGLLTTAVMLGSMVGEAPLAWLTTSFGWRHTMDVCGMFGLILAALFYLCVRDSSITELHMQPNQSLRVMDYLSVLKLPHNWWLMLYSGLAFSPLAVLGGLWGTPFLQTAYHITKPDAASLTSLMFLGFAMGSPLFGLLSDYFQRRFTVMFLGLLLSAAGLLAAIYMPTISVWLEALYMFLFGAGTGAFLLVFAVGKDLNSIMLTATVVSFINSGDALFGSFSEPLIGKILDFGWNGVITSGAYQFSLHDYRIALSVLPLYLCAALFCLYRVARKK